MSTALTSLLKNRYALQEVLGRGGMAVVYRAFDTVLGREVAIKLFAASSDDIEGARQEAEVNVLASLSHHSLVTLFDAGVDRSDRENPRVFLVMELVRGSDLQRALNIGPLSARQIAQIGYDLAEGLSYIHRRGVVHRDIKPSNVLLVDYEDESNRTRAMLTDFGIAHRGIHQQDPNSTTTTGTAAYLSPEQVRRDPVGPASDVYSLGLVLLECFTAQLAYPGEPVDSAMSRLIQDPAMPRDLSDPWRGLLTAMTSRDPRDRPLANELVLSLRDLMTMETGRHREPDPESAAPRPPEIRRPALAREIAFDRITTLAARVLGAPIAIVAIDDLDRVWFSSHYGMGLEQLEQQVGPLASAVYNGEAWMVNGKRVDARALTTSAAAAKHGFGFFAGVPLTTHDGYQLGTLCVLDSEPRPVSESDIITLIDLAEMALSELELRLAGLRRAQY